MANNKAKKPITGLKNRRGIAKLIHIDEQTLATLQSAAVLSPQHMVKPYIEEVLRKHAQQLREGGVV